MHIGWRAAANLCAQAALCAAPPLRVLPVDVLRIADAFAAFCEVQVWFVAREAPGRCSSRAPRRLPEWRRAQGRLVRAFGRKGDGPGQFHDGRLSVAVGQRGDVFVADSVLWACRVQVFRPDGTFVRAWGSFGSGPGQLHCPCGICVSAAGEVFVAEAGNHRVQVFSAEGAFVRAFGSEGAAPGQLSHPLGVALSAAGELFVADMSNHRVSVFRASDGAFLRSFSGSLRYPDGVAVSAAGEVFVSQGQSVHVFRGNDGVFLRALPVSLCAIYGMTLTAAGDLLVTVGTSERAECRLLRAGDGGLLHSFVVPRHTMVAVGAAGEVIIGAGGDSRVQIFE